MFLNSQKRLHLTKYTKVYDYFYLMKNLNDKKYKNPLTVSDISKSI